MQTSDVRHIFTGLSNGGAPSSSYQIGSGLSNGVTIPFSSSSSNQIGSGLPNGVTTPFQSLSSNQIGSGLRNGGTSFQSPSSSYQIRSGLPNGVTTPFQSSSSNQIGSGISNGATALPSPSSLFPTRFTFGEPPQSLQPVTIQQPKNTVNIDKLTSLSQKRKLYHELIVSLESIENADAIIAEVTYDDLISIYYSYTWNVEETASLLRDSVLLDELIANAKEMQRKVISLRGSLKKIMLNQSPPSTKSQVNNQTNRRVEISNNFEALNSSLSTEKIAESDATLKNVINQDGISIVPGSFAKPKLNDKLSAPEPVQQRIQRSITIKPVKSSDKSITTFTTDDYLRNFFPNMCRPTKLFALHAKSGKCKDNVLPGGMKASKSPETIQQNLSADDDRIKSVKSKDDVVSKPAELDELTNKTKTTDLNDAASKPSEKTETNDQANQAIEKDPENLFETINKHFQTQNSLLKKITLLQLSDVTSDDEIEMRSDYLLYLRQSFITNQSELEKYLNPFTLQQQRKLAQKVLKALSDVQFKLDHSKRVVNDV